MTEIQIDYDQRSEHEVNAKTALKRKSGSIMEQCISYLEISRSIIQSGEKYLQHSH
jgi:hypothetical protein